MAATPDKRESTSPASVAELVALLETLYNSRNPTRRWLHRTRRDWIIAKIGECARLRPGRAIEIGFGAGVYLPALAEAYSEVVAADLDQIHIEHARPIAERYPNLRLAIDDITASRMPDHSFDLALCSEVIEHIPDPQAAIAGIRRLLAPGGFFILSTPQRYSLLELACKIAFLPGVIGVVRRLYGEAIFETGHISLTTEREIGAALEREGFEIRERFKSGMYLPVVAEFGGAAGMQLERWLEDRIRRGRLSWVLWTQYWIARAPA
jgi:2-polyprenyl-3-methyl-5-hydroxy-6-metoxy-1,4-benzoquinol methylase